MRQRSNAGVLDLLAPSFQPAVLVSISPALTLKELPTPSSPHCFGSSEMLLGGGITLGFYPPFVGCYHQPICGAPALRKEYAVSTATHATYGETRCCKIWPGQETNKQVNWSSQASCCCVNYFILGAMFYSSGVRRTQVYH